MCIDSDRRSDHRPDSIRSIKRRRPSGVNGAYGARSPGRKVAVGQLHTQPRPLQRTGTENVSGRHSARTEGRPVSDGIAQFHRTACRRRAAQRSGAPTSVPLAYVILLHWSPMGSKGRGEGSRDQGMSDRPVTASPSSADNSGGIGMGCRAGTVARPILPIG